MLKKKRDELAFDTFEFSKENLNVDNMGRRMFTVQGSAKATFVYKIKVEDLVLMQTEYPIASNKLFFYQYERLLNLLERQ